MTLNINDYGSKHGPWEQRRRIISGVIDSAGPDLVLLQAVARDPSIDGGVDQASQLASGLRGYRALFRPVVSATDGKAQGMAFLSRLRILSTRTRPLTYRDGLDDTNRRAVIAATVHMEETNEMLNVVNVHFSWVPEQAFDNVRETAQFLRSLATGPSLLGGDFNTQPDSDILQPLRSGGWTDAWSALHRDSPGCTFESDQPAIRIDYIWTNAALARLTKSIEIVAAAASVGPAGEAARASDHCGLLAEFAQPDRR